MPEPQDGASLVVMSFCLQGRGLASFKVDTDGGIGRYAQALQTHHLETASLGADTGNTLSSSLIFSNGGSSASASVVTGRPLLRVETPWHVVQ